MDLAPFAALVESNQLGEVASMIEHAIVGSFVARPHFLHLTKKSAITDRFRICARIFRVLRGDLKWSIHRIRDHILAFLLNELDGVTWEPSAASMWSPDAVA